MAQINIGCQHLGNTLKQVHAESICLGEDCYDVARINGTRGAQVERWLVFLIKKTSKKNNWTPHL